MTRVKLRDAETATKEIAYQKRPELWAKQCDSCGMRFRMETLANVVCGVMTGIFDQVVKEHGNQFTADVCSLACADQLFMDGWKEMDAYRPFVERGAVLERVSVSLQRHIVLEDDLVRAWEDLELSPQATTVLDAGTMYLG